MVSQPSISQYISKLEDEIGVQIFERSVPLKLTYAGELYVKTARKILMEEAELEERLKNLRGDISGELKIGSSYLNAVFILPELVAEFQKHFPLVQVEIFEDTEPNLKLMVDAGKLDLVVATSKFDSSFYEKVLLCEDEYVFAVPKTFGDLGSGTSNQLPGNREFPVLDISLLEKIPVIRLQSNIFLRELTDSLYDIYHIRPTSIIECTTALGAYYMVKAGAGATIISYITYRMDYSAKVNYYAIPGMNQSRKINLVYNKNKYLTNSAKEFIKIGQNHYKNK